MAVKLPPGYQLLEQTGDIILAFNRKSLDGRYATWLVDFAGIGVHSGHYFGKIQRAVSDFLERSGEEKTE